MLRSLLIASLVFLSSCAYVHLGYRPTCYTQCGMEGDFTPTTCSELREAEYTAILAFQKDVPTFIEADMMCVGIQGYKVFVHSRNPLDDAMGCVTGWWGGSECVVGQERSDRRTIELANTDFMHNALTHELAHALDRWFFIKKTEKHCGWAERGIELAIADVTGKEDGVEEVCQ